MARSIHDLTTTLSEEYSATPDQLTSLLESSARQIASIDGVDLDLMDLEEEFADHLLDVMRMGLDGEDPATAQE